MSKQYSLIAELVVKANNFNKSMNEASEKTNKFAKNFADKTKNIGEGLSNVGKSMSMKVTAPIVAGAGLAVNAFKNFDDSMRNTQALLGDKLGKTTQEQEKNLKLLSDSAKEAGINTKFSASESSEALGFMALAGWDVESMLSGLNPVLNLASAGNMDLALASDIVTDSMSMFAMEAEEAERMTDVLAKTSSSTNTDIEQLGDAFTYVGANAHASGMDIETTSAFIGKLADAGIKGSKAGTTLNSMLSDMKDKAEDGALAIGDTSVAVYDGQGNMRDMTDVIDDMIGATADMTDEQRDLALSQIFGQQALKGVNTLMTEGAGATKELRDELYNSEGTAKSMADILEGGLGGSLRNLKSAVEGMAISFGETLAPMLQVGAEKLTEIIRKFADLDEGKKKVIITVGALLAGLGPVLLIFGKIIGVIGSVVGALASITPPVLAVIGIITALVAIGVSLYKNWDIIKEKAIEVFSNFEPLFDTVKEAFQNLMDGLEPIVESLKDLWQSLLPILEILGAIVGGVVVTAFGLFISVINGVIAGIAPMIEAFINFADYIVNMVNVVVALFTGDFAGAFEYLKDAGQSAVDFFVNIFTGLIEFVKTFVKTIVDFFKGLYKSLVDDNVSKMVNDIVDWFKNLGKWVVDLVVNLVKGTVNKFKDLLKSAKDIFNKIKDGILNPIKSAKDKVVSLAKSLYTGAKDKFSSLLSSAKDIFNKVKNAIINPFTTAKEKVVSLASNVFTGVKNKFSSLKSSVTTIFNNVKDAMFKPIEKARDKIKGAIGKVKGFFTGMKLKFPKIKMPKLPKFSLTGKFSLMPPSVPKLSIKWNAKGGIFNKPTIFNTANAGLQGIGEAGEEAILPLTKSVLGTIGDRIFSNMKQGQTENTTNNNKTEVNYGDIIITVQNGDKKKSENIATEIMKELRKKGR